MDASALPMGPDPTVKQREVSLLTSFWIPFVFTVILMVTRFSARSLRRSIGPDDWSMLAAWILYVVCLALSTTLVAKGAFNHIWLINPNLMVFIPKVVFIDTVVSIGALCLSKTAVALLLIRILKGTNDRWQKPFLYANIALYAAVSIIAIVSSATQCDPPSAQWHPELVAQGLASCPRTELNVKFSIWHAAVGAWMDFMLALLPITFVYKLNVSLKRKIGICFLLGLGVFAGVCAIIKSLQFTHGFATADPTYNSYSLWFWAALEVPFVIIAGSIPPSKPVFDKFVKGIPISQASSVGAHSAHSSNPAKKGWFSKLGSHDHSAGSSQSTQTDSRDGLATPNSEKVQHMMNDSNNSIVVKQTFSVEHGQHPHSDSHIDSAV